VEEITLRVDGKPVPARRGEPVASALFRSGRWVLGRSVKYHRPRGPFCFQGSCGGCLMRIDGQPNQRACRTVVAEGMEIEAQNVYPSVAIDMFSATDFFFPRGMDHHTLFTGAPRPVHAVMQKIARQLAGLGRLPDDRPLQRPPAEIRRVDVIVVGAGPAGLAAAIAAARGGRRVLLLDENDRAGGSMLADPRHGPLAAQLLVDDAQAAGVELLLRTTALGWYPEDRAPGSPTPGLLAAAMPDRLLLITAVRVLYATGSYDQNALFPDNDRPGVLSARAVGRLLVRDGIIPARRVLVLGAGPYARALGEALASAGSDVLRVDGLEETIAAVHGTQRVTGATLTRAAQARKGTRRVRCDLIAVAALPAPATELPREHGVGVRWEASVGGFHVEADRDGRTSIPGVSAVGDVAGFLGAQAALEAGERVGAVLAAEANA
jgi:sarcosine oxidase subunit alpha